MAANFRRFRARRRLASLAFLSTISFEGDGRDNSFGTILKHDGGENGRNTSDKTKTRDDLINFRTIQNLERFNSGKYLHNVIM